MKKYTFLFLLLFTVFKSYSCPCSFFGSLESDIKTSNLIIKGKVVKEKKIVMSRIFIGNDLYKVYGFLYTIEIDEIYKGKKKKKQIKIISGQGGGDCGYRFNIGDDYIIYSSDKNRYVLKSYFYTSICTSTQVYNRKTEKAIIDYLAENK